MKLHPKHIIHIAFHTTLHASLHPPTSNSAFLVLIGQQPQQVDVLLPKKQAELKCLALADACKLAPVTSPRHQQRNLQRTMQRCIYIQVWVYMVCRLRFAIVATVEARQLMSLQVKYTRKAMATPPTHPQINQLRQKRIKSPTAVCFDSQDAAVHRVLSDQVCNSSFKEDPAEVP